ncbi:hypothetical protein CSUI_009532 [Cystoisospora suis]|uniref:Uncharacterized protein n=1 Tax=Cystoisospora suis TaxID=483139 RepID=A0A2C6KJT4_9APIC|nr:hypothetical protein CSUI_009532 [Cystoisospora suis]
MCFENFPGYRFLRFSSFLNEPSSLHHRLLRPVVSSRPLLSPQQSTPLKEIGTERNPSIFIFPPSFLTVSKRKKISKRMSS